MTKTEIKKIEKRLKTSADFQNYAFKNPKVFKNIPNGITIIFDSYAKEKELLKDVSRSKVYRAKKELGHWKLQSA